nr:unnamed protein product [Spirometra erinaceieuropaei]
MRVEDLYPPFPFISIPDFHSVKVEWFECLEELAEESVICFMEVTLRKKDSNKWDQIYFGNGTYCLYQELEPGTEYELRLRLKWDKDFGPFGSVEAFETPPEPDTAFDLHKAIKFEDIEAIQRILSTSIINILLNAQANVNAANKLGKTALMLAANKGFIDVVDILVKRGASVDAKSCVDTLAPWLHEVIERAWRDEVVPDDWVLGIPVSILKNGDKTRCDNDRGISLIDVAAKIFAIVLLRRFQAVRDSRTRPNQAGFCAGRGCADQIFTLRRILEFRHSYQQPTAVCFVDFAVAFDSFHRESLWRIMALDGVPAKIIAMIKAYYRSTTARVPVRNNLSQPFGIRSGVRQGCILSPILFNYAIEWILGRTLRESDGVEFAPRHRLTDLDYADDIALLAPSFGDLQSMVSRVNEVAKSVGLSINAAKNKVLSSCIPDQAKAPLGIDGCHLEEVDSFNYLGARLLPNGQRKADIISRIDAARWVFSSLRKCLWIRRDLSIATKIRVYRASARSFLLYGCACWALRVKDERKLEVSDNHCLRTILRVKFTDFVSNETVGARCDNIARITQAIQERRLRWFGHVLRRPPQELNVTALDPAVLPHWRRRRGGQFKTWLDTVRQDMEVVLGPSVFGLRRWRREWVELSRSAAADRHAWRGTVLDIIEAG